MLMLKWHSRTASLHALREPAGSAEAEIIDAQSLKCDNLASMKILDDSRFKREYSVGAATGRV